MPRSKPFGMVGSIFHNLSKQIMSQQEIFYINHMVIASTRSYLFFYVKNIDSDPLSAGFRRNRMWMPVSCPSPLTGDGRVREVTNGSFVALKLTEGQRA